jgi:iron complex outermembrane recepter protein
MAQVSDGGSIQELRGRPRRTKALKANDLPTIDALRFGTSCARPLLGEAEVSAKDGLVRKRLCRARLGRCVVFAAILLTMQQAWAQGPPSAQTSEIQQTPSTQEAQKAQAAEQTPPTQRGAQTQPPAQEQPAPQTSPAPQGDLTQVSIENLMNMEVTSVSKKDQKLSQVAAAIFVITQEDIRRSGSTNIPDLLRMVPGMDVAQINGSTWAIGARGFNQQFSNKLLVMIDGRIVYTPNFAGVYWDTLGVPLEDIERIEVIRGPGGTIWGANAVDGVISIFTKKAGETQGGLIVAGGGNVNQAFGTLQYGEKLKDETDYRIYAKYSDQEEMPGLNGQDGGDGWHMLRTGFRTDSTLSPKDKLMVEGDLYSGREGEQGFELPSVSSPGFVAVNEEIDLGGGSIESVWNHTYSERSDSTLQVSFNRYTRDDPLEPETRDTLDLDYQHHIALSKRHDIVWGVGYHFTTDHIGGSLTVSFNPPSRVLQVFNGFLQDEIALVPNRLYLTIGTKLEHNDYTGFEVMPSARASWSLSDRHMVWAAVSRALRAPSRNDTNLVLNLGEAPGPGGAPTLLRLVGNPQFQDEQLIAYEAGYRAMLSRRFSIDIATYFNQWSHVQSTEPSVSFFENAPPPAHEVQTVTYENLIHGENHGFEISANLKATDRWSISVGYAPEETHMHTAPMSADTQTVPFLQGATPNWPIQLRSHMDLSQKLAWDVSTYFVDALEHQGPSGNVTVPSYTRLDTGLTWKLAERLSFSVVGQNLSRDHHLEFEDVDGSMQSGQIKRSAYGKFTWQF